VSEFSDAIEALEAHGLTLAIAESLTGGLLTARFVTEPGAGDTVSGGIVAYARSVKSTLFEVDPDKVVCPEAAIAMAAGVRRQLDADVGVGVTGVAGPATQDGQPVGTVYAAVALHGDRPPEAVHRRFEGSPDEVRDRAARWAASLVRDLVAALPVETA
jgi:nicotinamide-nucleotide amidase